MLSCPHCSPRNEGMLYCGCCTAIRIQYTIHKTHNTLLSCLRGPYGVQPSQGGPSDPVYLPTWAENFESFERINSIRETNGNFDSCNSCKRLGTSRLHELHVSKFSFVTRIEIIRSKLSKFSAHVYRVRNVGKAPGRVGESLPGRVWVTSPGGAPDGPPPPPPAPRRDPARELYVRGAAAPLSLAAARHTSRRAVFREFRETFGRAIERFLFFFVAMSGSRKSRGCPKHENEPLGASQE